MDPSFDDTNSTTANIAVKNPFEGIVLEDIHIIEESYDNIISSDQNEESAETNQKTVDTNKNSTTNESTKAVDHKKINLPNPSQGKSYNQIVGTYKLRFEKMQEKQENGLYALMDEGKKEYTQLKESKSSVMSLASKYLKRINTMEKEADKEFNTLIHNLKTELNSNSYPTDIVKEINDYYNYYKKTLRAQLMKKATQQL